MKDFKRELVFKVKDNSYLVKSPTARQLLSIETAKSTVSAGSYGNIMSMVTKGGNYALDIVDVYAYITVLVPDLAKDIEKTTNGSILNMDIFDFNELNKAFKEQMNPWINNIMNMISAPPAEDNDTDDDTDNDTAK